MNKIVKIIKGLTKGGILDIVEKYDVKQHRAVGAAYNIGKSRNGSIVFNTDGAKILGYVEIPGRPQKTRFTVFNNPDGINVFVQKNNKITKTGEIYNLSYKEIITAREKVMKIVTNPKFKETETYKKFLLLKAIGEGDNFLKLTAVLVELGWLSFRKIAVPGYQKFLEEAKEVVPLILDKEEEDIKAEVAVTEEVEAKEEAVEAKEEAVEAEEEIQEILSSAAKLGNAMSAAHYIRRKLLLEGHYHAQMKIALDLYYKFIKASASVKVSTTTKTPAANKVLQSTTTTKTASNSQTSTTKTQTIRTIAPDSEEYAKLIDLHSKHVKIDKNRMIILEGKHLYYLNKINRIACSLSDNIPILPDKYEVYSKLQRQAMLANGYPEEVCHDGKEEWFKFMSLPNFNKIRNKMEEVYNTLLEKHTSAIIKTIKNKGREIFRGNKARIVFVADISKPEILKQIPIHKWKVVND